MQTPPPNRHSERAAYRRVIPRRFVDLALVTQNRGFEPMDLEITVFILYNKKEKSKRIHIVRWGSMSAQNRKSCNTAIRSACPHRLRHTRRSSSAAVTGCGAPPCSSDSAQRRAPACGRARAGCASGRERPRVARPSARAPHGRRGAACGRVRPSETSNVFRKTVGLLVVAHRQPVRLWSLCR